MSSDNYVHKPMMSDLLCKQEKIRQMLNYYFFPMSFVNITQSFYPYITSVPSKRKNKITSTNVCQNWEHFNK